MTSPRVCMVIGNANSKWNGYVQSGWCDENNVTVAVINRAAWDYPKGAFDYWFSLHPDIFFQNIPDHLQDFPKDRMWGWSKKWNVHGEYHRVERRAYPRCGSSGRFACENMICALGFDKVIIYGIELHDRYKRYRYQWTPFLEHHLDQIEDRSTTQWLNRGLWRRK